MNNAVGILNTTTLLIILFCTISGFIKGFLRSAIDLVATILSIPLSYGIAKIISTKIDLTTIVNIQNVELFKDKINFIICMIISFIIVNIIFKIASSFAKKFNKIILVGTLNRFLGVAFGLITSLIVIFIISIPVNFKPFGLQDFYNKSIMSDVNKLSTKIVSSINNEELKKIFISNETDELINNSIIQLINVDINDLNVSEESKLNIIGQLESMIDKGEGVDEQFIYKNDSFKDTLNYLDIENLSNSELNDLRKITISIFKSDLIVKDIINDVGIETMSSDELRAFFKQLSQN